MRTYRANFIFHKFFPFTFSVFLLGFTVVGLIAPEVITTTVNGVDVETNFFTLLPGLLIGLPLLKLGIWLNKNYFRVYMDDEVIDVFKGGEKIRIKWEDIESINTIDWLWKGTIFKIKPKD